MAEIYTINHERTNWDTLEVEYTHTNSWLQAHPAGEPWRDEFQKFYTRFTETRATERTLLQNVKLTSVKVFLLDRSLNEIVSKLIKLVSLQNKTTTEELKQLYLKDVPPSEFTRGIMGPQLETMRGWIVSLKTSAIQELRPIGAELEPVIAASDIAIQRERLATQALEDFWQLGGWRSLCDDFNILRRRVYHSIAEKEPEIAYECFLHDTSRSTDLETGIKQSKSKIEKLERQLEEEKKRLGLLLAQKTERDTREAERQAALAELEALKQEKKAIKKREQELKAKSKKK